jgi:thiamine pyrophosphate-dependent acetolactate synthase large subunit-like protein
MNGGQAVAEVLRQEGVEVVFCFPSNPLIDAAAAVGIQPIVGREERTVINMADAYSRVSNGRRIGVSMVQFGPGAEHSFGGIAQAYSDSVPLLLLPGGAARGRLGLRTSFDSVEAYRPITKWASRFSTAESVPEQLRRAFAKMRSGRPGPVVLEMPGDVVVETFDHTGFSYSPPGRPRGGADPEAVETAVSLLLAARRPVIHVGQGVLWAEATPELVAFADLVGAPVMTTYTAKSVFPENHPLALGAGGAAVSPGIHGILPGADLVFSVGSSLLRSLGSVGIPAGKTIIQCTNDPDDLSMEYPIAAGLVGDAKLVLVQLIEAVERQRSASAGRSGGWGGLAAEEVAAVRRQAAAAAAPMWSSDEMPINPLRVVAELMAALDPDETIITHDSGYPRDHLAPNYVSTKPRSYLGWGNSTPLGSSLGLALGAKAAAPDKVVVNFMGDAAFGQSGLDLETGVRNHLAIVCVVINNSQMGNYEKMQPVAQEKFDIKRLSGSYAVIATALGATARRVEHPDEVGPALKEAIDASKAGQTVMLEIITKAEPAYLRL